MSFISELSHNSSIGIELTPSLAQQLHNHALVTLYSRIPDYDPSLTDADSIRLWMVDNQESLKHITTLDLSSCKLTTLPPEIETFFPALTSLDLRNNPLTTTTYQFLTQHPYFKHIPNLKSDIHFPTMTPPMEKMPVNLLRHITTFLTYKEESTWSLCSKSCTYYENDVYATLFKEIYIKYASLDRYSSYLDNTAKMRAIFKRLHQAGFVLPHMPLATVIANLSKHPIMLIYQRILFKQITPPEDLPHLSSLDVIQQTHEILSWLRTHIREGRLHYPDEGDWQSCNLDKLDLLENLSDSEWTRRTWRLNLSNNNFTSIPSLANYPRLWELDLRDNPLPSSLTFRDFPSSINRVTLPKTLLFPRISYLTIKRITELYEDVCVELEWMARIDTHYTDMHTMWRSMDSLNIKSSSDLRSEVLARYNIIVPPPYPPLPTLWDPAKLSVMVNVHFPTLYQMCLNEVYIGRHSESLQRSYMGRIWDTMHDLNVTFQSDIRSEVLSRYNALITEPFIHLPIKWNEGQIETEYSVDIQTLLQAFEEIVSSTEFND